MGRPRPRRSSYRVCMHISISSIHRPAEGRAYICKQTKQYESRRKEEGVRCSVAYDVRTFTWPVQPASSRSRSSSACLASLQARPPYSSCFCWFQVVQASGPARRGRSCGTLLRPRGAEMAPENVCDQIKYIVDSEEQDRGIAGRPGQPPVPGCARELSRLPLPPAVGWWWWPAGASNRQCSKLLALWLVLLVAS